MFNEVSINCKPTLVEVQAQWSGGSHLMDLIITKIEEDFHNQINVIRIDLEIHKEFLCQFGIESAPALLIINNGQIIKVIKETLPRINLEKIVRNLIIKNRSTLEERKTSNS